MPKIIDPRTRLSEDFEPNPAPDMSGVPPPPRLLPVIHPPSLCEQGPCAHYHEITALADAATPMDGSLRVHVQVLRTCYPHAGIEMPLNGSPVFECNRYVPDMHADGDALERFRRSARGQAIWTRYQADLAQYHALVASTQQPAINPTTAPTEHPDLAETDEQRALLGLDAIDFPDPDHGDTP